LRERRFVLDGPPVMLSPSYLPADIVRGSAITREEAGPGGTYARLTEHSVHRRWEAHGGQRDDLSASAYILRYDFERKPSRVEAQFCSIPLV
jgi:hypothetical protein